MLTDLNQVLPQVGNTNFNTTAEPMMKDHPDERPPLFSETSHISIKICM